MMKGQKMLLYLHLLLHFCFFFFTQKIIMISNTFNLIRIIINANNEFIKKVNALL